MNNITKLLTVSYIPIKLLFHFSFLFTNTKQTNIQFFMMIKTQLPVFNFIYSLY